MGITLTKTPNVTSLGTPGQNVTWTIRLTADPSAGDSGVLLSDQIPTGCVYTSASQDPNDATQFAQTNPGVGTGGTVQWTAASLPAGSTATFTLVLFVTHHASPQVTNKVRYTSDNVPSPGVQAVSVPVTVP